MGTFGDDESVIVRLQVRDGVAESGASPYDAIGSDTFASVPMDVPLSAVPRPASEQPLNALFGRPMAERAETPIGIGDQMIPLIPPMPPLGVLPQCTASPQVPRPGVPTAAAAPMASNVVHLLAEFGEKSKNNDWPMSTSVHCYWCCHQFDTMPYGLPHKYSGGQFHVVGCFCSLECACAYNFSSNRDSVDECLNRYSLINALSAAIGLGRVVRPAPDRLSLAIFGGHLDVDKFRAFGSDAVCPAGNVQQQQHQQQQRSTAAKQLIVNSPPMQSLTQQVEEVNSSDLSSEYRYIPLDSDRVSRYQEKIRLMRTKPLINFKNTLDHTMKLKYTEKSEA